jgi:hypothetical protein
VYPSFWPWFSPAPLRQTASTLAGVLSQGKRISENNTVITEKLCQRFSQLRQSIYLLFIYINIININKIYNNNAHFSKTEKSRQRKHHTPSAQQKNTSPQAVWFEQFWQAYPVKKAKQRVKQLFCRLVTSETLFHNFA